MIRKTILFLVIQMWKNFIRLCSWYIKLKYRHIKYNHKIYFIRNIRSKYVSTPSVPFLLYFHARYKSDYSKSAHT